MPAVYVREPSRATRALSLHLCALTLGAASIMIYSWMALADRPSLRAIGHCAFVCASLLETTSLLMSYRSRKPDRPRWAKIWLAHKPFPVRARLVLDMDAASFTYRAQLRFRRSWWIPSTLITKIVVNALGEEDTLVFGRNLSFTYRDVHEHWRTMQGM